MQYPALPKAAGQAAARALPGCCDVQGRRCGRQGWVRLLLLVALVLEVDLVGQEFLPRTLAGSAIRARFAPAGSALAAWPGMCTGTSGRR
jgi:hypothetical protein